MTPIRLLVTGGRAFGDLGEVNRRLDQIHRELGIAVVIHGDATGADALAKRWALEHRVPQEPHPAEWHRYGSAAGPIRNSYMAFQTRADAFLAFPGGAGTRDCIRKCIGAGVPPVDSLLPPSSPE